jgi:hypothetical protein
VSEAADASKQTKTVARKHAAKPLTQLIIDLWSGFKVPLPVTYFFFFAAFLAGFAAFFAFLAMVHLLLEFNTRIVFG